MQFKNLLAEAYWKESHENAHDAAVELYNKVETSLDKLAPFTTVKQNKTTYHWYDKEIIKQANLRDFLYKVAITKNDINSWKMYKEARNKTTYIIKAKRKHTMRSN